MGLRLLPLPLPPLLDVRRAAVAAAPDDGRAGLYHGGVEAAGGVARNRRLTAPGVGRAAPVVPVVGDNVTMGRDAFKERRLMRKESEGTSGDV